MLRIIGWTTALFGFLATAHISLNAFDVWSITNKNIQYEAKNYEEKTEYLQHIAEAYQAIYGTTGFEREIDVINPEMRSIRFVINERQIQLEPEYLSNLQKAFKDHCSDTFINEYLLQYNISVTLSVMSDKDQVDVWSYTRKNCNYEATES